MSESFGSSVTSYSLLIIAGILTSAALWGRITRRGSRHDGRLTGVYFCGLLGALLGAKLSFLLAEGWHYRHDGLALLSGRSVTGALLGGYLGVELGKRWLRYPGTTGDAFAIVAPVGLLLGRVGCLLQGCCPGIECTPHWWSVTDVSGATRWPAAWVELGFNVVFLIWAVLAARRSWATGNRFHVYLVAYGVFRFAHEVLRADQRLLGPLTGYHLLALLLVGFGAWRYHGRTLAQGVSLPMSRASCR